MRDEHEKVFQTHFASERQWKFVTGKARLFTGRPVNGKAGESLMLTWLRELGVHHSTVGCLFSWSFAVIHQIHQSMEQRRWLMLDRDFLKCACKWIQSLQIDPDCALKPFSHSVIPPAEESPMFDSGARRRFPPAVRKRLTLRHFSMNRKKCQNLHHTDIL